MAMNQKDHQVLIISKIEEKEGKFSRIRLEICRQDGIRKIWDRVNLKPESKSQIDNLQIWFGGYKHYLSPTL